MRNSEHPRPQDQPLRHINSAPRTYHVFHLVKGHDEWKIIDADNNTLVDTLEHEIKARQAIIQLALANRPSRVVIYNMSGKICGSSMYP
jgi:hypothetical protein